MLGLAEYIVLKGEFLQLGKDIEAQVASKIAGKDKTDALEQTYSIGRTYIRKRDEMIKSGLLEIARNALNHYGEQVSPDEPLEQFAESIVNAHYKDDYYGANLQQRLAVSNKQLTRRMINTANLDHNLLDQTFTQTYPHGAQVPVDQRIFLGYAAKTENDIAQFVAKKVDIPFIRWTLSHRHKQEDACDDLATAVDKNVVAYIDENQLTIDPKGLYFANQLPRPPHPNCQCEYGLTSTSGTQTRNKVKRTVQKVKSLLRRLRRK